MKNRSKKIAYFLDVFPVYSETFITREILELKRLGFNISILSLASSKGSLSGSVIHEESQALVGETYYYTNLRKSSTRLRLIGYHIFWLTTHPIRYTKTLLFSIFNNKKTFDLFKKSILYVLTTRKLKIKHIHAHFALDSCTLAMLVSMMTGIRYSFTIHAHDIFVPKLAELIPQKINRSKFVVCISGYNKKLIQEKYSHVHSDRMKIIHCGVDLKKIRPIKKSKSKSFSIVSVGRLHEQKGYIYLIEALEILQNHKSINFKCEIIGEGRQRKHLSDLIKNKNLTNRVLLSGAKQQSETIAKVGQADVFVLPCIRSDQGHMDGIPVALMEAMAMQIPVISTDISGIPELIKNGAGTIVKPNDASALAAAIIEIGNKSVDQRKRIGIKERIFIEEYFNLDMETKKIGNLIDYNENAVLDV